MSDLSEKLSTPSESTGRARASLSQLKSRLGFKVLGEDVKGEPTWVAVDFMVRTTWRRIPGSPRGAEAIFEVEEGT